MPFRKVTAAKTLISVATAMHANWAAMPPSRRRDVQEWIDKYGHEIFQRDPPNRVRSILALLDEIDKIRLDLPQPVQDALVAGSGDVGTGFVRVPDPERDEVLQALRRVYDARHYDDARALADAVGILVQQSRGRLDPASWAEWERLDAEYRTRRNINASQYLDGIAAAVGSKLADVQEKIDQGKSWAAVPHLGGGLPPKPLPTTAPPPPPPPPTTGGIKGLGEADMSGGVPRGAPAAPALVQRSANVYFPRMVQLTQTMIPLIVHIAREAAAETVEITEGDRRIVVSVGALKIFVNTGDFRIEKAIGGVEIEDVDNGRIVQVDAEKDSEPVIFFLTPKLAGEKRISIEFKQFSKKVGSLGFDVTVVEEAVPATRQANVVDNKDHPFRIAARTASTSGQAVPPPDLDLRVLRRERTLTYFLSSADDKYQERIVGQKELEVDPGPYFAGIAQTLSALAAKKPERRTDDDREAPARLGRQLWDQLIPAELRQIYRDDLRVNFAGKSLRITTDEPWIPWEMLRPNELSEGRYLFVDPPLCEKFRLTRWMANRDAAPDEVELKRGVIVAPPEDTLPSVIDEVAYFTTWSWMAAVRTKRDAIQEFSRGAEGLFHFSCHGGVGPTEAWLKLGDEDLMASSVEHGLDVNLARSFIFLNACEAGQAQLTITGLDGWALAFLRRYASVFIGSLWSINDKLASQFARAFYDCLLGLNGQQPQPIGVAFQFARQAIKEKDSDNPTWLAYVLYGDPNGRVFHVSD